MFHCENCNMQVDVIGGVAVVVDTGTTADGLSFCPPDPDYKGDVRMHVPVKRELPHRVGDTVRVRDWFKLANEREG